MNRVLRKFRTTAVTISLTLPIWSGGCINARLLNDNAVRYLADKLDETHGLTRARLEAEHAVNQTIKDQTDAAVRVAANGTEAAQTAAERAEAARREARDQGRLILWTIIGAVLARVAAAVVARVGRTP